MFYNIIPFTYNVNAFLNIGDIQQREKHLLSRAFGISNSFIEIIFQAPAITMHFFYFDFKQLCINAQL